ncbi:MAG: protein-methionine-sulfoxide reductase heme-binding subunit MsrQ [Terriglobales bacterium]
MLIRWLKVVVFVSCLGPAAFLAWKGYESALGANPIEVITHSTGNWTLIFLLITLSVTPARELLRQPWLIRFRRMFGLFAFFYATLHFLTYIWLDKFFDLHEVFKDIAKRRFITVGFAAFLLLIPLAVTSTSGWIRRLGGKRWRALHRLIYFSAIGGVIHYLWLVKADKSSPLEYGSVLAVLLGYRLVMWSKSFMRSKNIAVLPGRNSDIPSA